MPGPIAEVEEEQVVQPLKPVLRVATAEDRAMREESAAREAAAFAVCQEKIAKHGLDMKLVDVEYTFNGGKVIFYFTADERVDFRELVKDLAAHFHTRIELRQIGVRDEARMIGGLGSCGRPVCCKTFLDDFPSRLHPHGQGSEPFAQPDEDLRPVRPPHVLPAIRAGRL